MEKRKEPRQIKFRVTDEEYTRLENMADDVGLSVSKFAKQRVLGIKTRHPKIAKPEALQIAAELRRIGSNVNQIAKHANTVENVHMGQIRALQEELKAVWQSLN